MKANFHSALFIVFGFISSCTSKQEKELDNSPLLGVGFGINSATLVVQDLDSARNYFTKVLGFNMPLPKDFQNGVYEWIVIAPVTFPEH